MRVFYAITLISGAVIINVHKPWVLAVIYKICAPHFVLLFLY